MVNDANLMTEGLQLSVLAATHQHIGCEGDEEDSKDIVTTVELLVR